MITGGCAIETLIKNQLGETGLARGTGHFGAFGLFTWRRSAAMRGPHSAALAGRRPGFPRKRAHPPTQGSAHAHRSSFSQYGQRHIQGCISGAWLAAGLYAVGVGVRAEARRLPLLARLGSGETKTSVLGLVKDRRTPYGLRPSVGNSGAGALALMRAPALLFSGWAV